MKHKFGIVLIILGCGLLVAALSLFLRNQQEQNRAAAASQEAIAKVVEAIQDHNTPPEETSDSTISVTDEEQDMTVAVEERAMTVTEIDGYGYIGFLGLPSLELELPVMADWNYPQLKIAPCRYSGSIFTNDLVILAHNYAKHFGKLKDMHAGDLVTFTDMDGDTVKYQVVALEVLVPTAVAEVTAGDYDLTLFTCTYGGENRVVVYCDRIRN